MNETKPIRKKSTNKHKAIVYILGCIATRSDMTVWAQINHGFIYKSYWRTKYLTWKSDTGLNWHFMPWVSANQEIKEQGLARVSAADVINNWNEHGLYEDRVVEKLILKAADTLSMPEFEVPDWALRN